MERSTRNAEWPKLQSFPDESFPVVHPASLLELGQGTLAKDAAVVAELEKVLGPVPGTNKLLCSLKGGSFLCIHNAVVSWEDEKDELFMLLPPSRIAIKSCLLGKKTKNTGKLMILYAPCMAAIEFLGLNEEAKAGFSSAGHLQRAELFRKRGNEKFSRGEFVLATLFYAEATGAAEENHQTSELVLATSNNAQCMLKLHRYDDAIASCNKALSADPRHAKSFFRKAQALQALQSHTEALASFRSSLEFSERGAKAPVLEAIARSSSLAHQQQTGAYDVLEFFLNGFDEKHAPECSDFVSESVEIRITGDGKGRGVFLTRDVKVGELLMVSNPVASNPISDGGNAFAVRTIRSIGLSKRARGIVNSLPDSHSMTTLPTLQTFGPGSKNEEDGVIDVGRVKRILHLASFMFKVSGVKTEMVCGLPALINHSCLPNSMFQLIGGALFNRAAKNLKAGDELTITYVEALNPVAFRSEAFEDWGFRCRCERCEVENRYKRVLSRLPDPLKRYKDPEDILRCKAEEYGAVEKALEKLGNASELEKAMIRAGHIEAYMVVCLNKHHGICEEIYRRFKPISLTEVMKLLHDLVLANMKSILLIARIELRLMEGTQSSGSDTGHFGWFQDAMAALIGPARLPVESYLKLCEFFNDNMKFYKTFLCETPF